MTKMFSKKHLTVLISTFTVGTGIILACAGDWGPEYGTSSFTPEAFVDSSYRPFFYSGNYFYYDIAYDTKHDSRFNEVNVNDWSTYLGNDASTTELQHLLNTASLTAIDSVANYANGKIKSLPQSMQLFQLLKKPNAKTTSFINYLLLAKKSEDFAVSNVQYSWEYEEKKKTKPYANAATLNAQLLQQFTNAKDVFLKQRYWFQLERSYFFNEPTQKAIDFFESNEKAFPKNDMYYRTMAYAAGVYYKLKKYSKANYYYSKVYDGCIALRTVAHYSFHPQEQSDWNATLALCANNDEKATLWQMLGIFYGDAIRAMQEVYILNPKSEKLNLLLTRAVNAQEQSFSEWNDRIRDNVIKTKKDTTGNTLLTFVSRIAQAGNTGTPWMWYTATGYLQMLKGNTEKAAASYAQAEKKMPKEELAQMQVRLLKLINAIASTPKADAKLEKAILPELEWLANLKLDDGYFRHSSALSWIKQTLSDRYKAQKEYVKAACFSTYTQFYTNNSNIEAMKSFLSKANKTPYEAQYAKFYSLTINDLLEFQAIDLTLHDKLDEAIAKMEGAQAGNAILPGNPFNGRLQDCHDCDHEAAQKIKYTKLSLLKKMKDMEDKIKAGTDVYTNTMLLANAFYNITHYGNARAYYENKIVGEYHYSPYAIDDAFRTSVTDMTLASKYYTVGLNVAKTDEQKAKCYFMLAKCERNKYYNDSLYINKNYEYGYNNTIADWKAWDGFKSLKQYKTTKFYQEAIKECGYFRTYSRR